MLPAHPLSAALSCVRRPAWLPHWAAVLALSTAGLGLAVATGLTWALQQADARMQRDVAVKPRAVVYTTDAGTIERGRRLYLDAGCGHCHGADGRGRLFASGAGLRLVAPNLTPAGAVARYQPEDWNSAIRHGVKPSGQPVLAMPSERYNGWS
ncbi:MAG: c-type cytochrome, partial [Burkholderiaceae bacterium]